MTEILKRTTFIVADAERAAARYERIFGWTRYYDDELVVDGRFPPVAPDGSRARLVMLQAHDPSIGMLGFLSYKDFRPHEHRVGLGLGSPILVVSTEDAAALAKKAAAVEGIKVTGPAEWQVPAFDGRMITLKTVSLKDRDGLYFEASERAN